MASRGKKKTNNLTNQNVLVEEHSNVEINKKNFGFDIILTIVILGLLFVLLFAPLCDAKVSFDIIEENVFEKSFSMDIIDIIFAPSRGVYSGMDYLLEKAEVLSSNSAFKKAIDEIINTVMGKEKVDAINSLGVTIYIASILVMISYFVAVIFAVLERAGKKKKIKGLLISFSVFFGLITILLIASIVGYIKLLGNQNIFLSIGWGLVLNFTLAFILEASCIVEYILLKKNITGDKNENL